MPLNASMPVSRLSIFLPLVALALGCEARFTPSVAAPRPAAAATAAPTSTEPTHTPAPKAVTPRTEFKFEVMEMHSQGTYQFLIRNEGDAPLKLEVASTSCKCTAGTVDGQPIEPGESTFVAMTWNTGSQTRYYKQWATIKTNDPNRREISFYVEGPIRNDFRLDPETIELGEFIPGETKKVEAIIESDRNNTFEIARAVVSDPAFKVTTTPLEESELAAREMVRGFRFQIDVPQNLSKGDVNQVLQIALKLRPESEEVQAYSIPIEGRVLGKIAVAGPNVNQWGWITFGAKPHGVGAKAKLKVVVRDEVGELKIAKQTVEPDFLKVELTPSKSSDSGRVYDLVVEVPADAPPCAHRGDNMAKIHFQFDHPRIEKLDLKVDFSVRAPREFP
jgi:hypothetical protein